MVRATPSRFLITSWFQKRSTVHARLEDGGPPLVIRGLRCVLAAVELDDQPTLDAGEVGEVPVDG